MADTGMVFVVDDDPSMCELIEAALGRAGLKVRTFPSAEAFVDAKVIKDFPSSPSCLLLDLVLPGQSGLAFLEKHFKGLPCPIIMITAHGSIRDAVRAMKLGAADFLEKPFTTETLTKMVRETLQGHKDTDPMVRRRIAMLTPRERETLVDLVRGSSTRMVADRLGISPRTVDHYRANLLNKMRTNNVANLVRMVIQAGI